jgi:biopolymer transport protein ExbB
MGTFFFSQAAPFPFAPETLDLFAVMQKGGPLMWLILLGSIVGIGVFAERLLYFRASQIGVGEFLLGINNLLRRRNFQEALERCDDGKGPVVRVVRQAIVARKLPAVELREVVKEVAQIQLPRLEANMSILATIGHVMPLVGLLGTVTGMIDAFIEINRAAGAASVSDIASGIWTALITTAAGLAVAIPCDVGYNFLVSRMNQIISDMERAGIEVIHVLTEVNQPSVAVANPDAVVGSDNLTLLPPESVVPNPVIPAKAKVT